VVASRLRSFLSREGREAPIRGFGWDPAATRRAWDGRGVRGADAVRLPDAWAEFDAAKYDIVRAEQDPEGVWRVKEKITAWDYCAIRIWAADGSDVRHFADEVKAEFVTLLAEGLGGLVLSSTCHPPGPAGRAVAAA
jgi:hypothetical protein